MRKLEWLISAALALLILVSFQPHLPAWIVWFAYAVVPLTLLHLGLERARWQMGPVYLSAGFALLSIFAFSNLFYLRLGSGALALVLLMMGLALGWMLPMFRLPRPTGQYPVGSCMLYCVDPDRAEMHAWADPGLRQAIVQLWYPAASSRGKKAKYRRKKETTRRSSYQVVLDTHSIQDAPVAEGSFPLLLHNPSWHGGRQRGTFITQELASHGFIVAAISHPYNSSFVELADGRVAYPDYELDIGFSTQRYLSLQERFDLADSEVRIQTDDCRLVLDEIEKLNATPGHRLHGHVAMDRVGTYGHSFGGAVSLEFAREDARIRSVVELDGVVHGASAKLGVDKPLMMIDSPWMADPKVNEDRWHGRVVETEVEWRVTATRESTTMWNSIAEAKDAILRRCGGMRLVIAGLGHADFTDQIFMSPMRRFSQAGILNPLRVYAIVNTYVRAFFEQTLLDRPSPLLNDGTKSFEEATIHVILPEATSSGS